MPIERKTIFSPDRVYRYTLWRHWFDFQRGGFVMFIGLNPSTADETRDDPTIRRCIDYAKRWGFGALCMTNLFAFRATDPEVMKAAKEPIGPQNNTFLLACAADAQLIVAAWGNDGTHLNRGREILYLLAAASHSIKVPPIHILEMTKWQQPCHPLYKKKTLFPILLDIKNLPPPQF